MRGPLKQPRTMATKRLLFLLAVFSLALGVRAQTGSRSNNPEHVLHIALRMEGSTLPVTDRQVVAKAQLEKAVGLAVYTNAQGPDQPLMVNGFVVSAMVNGKLLEAAAKGDALTEEQKRILSKVVPGDTVYIENMEVKDGTGKARKCATHAIVVG